MFCGGQNEATNESTRTGFARFASCRRGADRLADCRSAALWAGSACLVAPMSELHITCGCHACTQARITPLERALKTSTPLQEMASLTAIKTKLDAVLENQGKLLAAIDHCPSSGDLRDLHQLLSEKFATLDGRVMA